METEIKVVLDGIKGSVESYGPRIAAIQKQLDAIDGSISQKLGNGEVAQPLVEKLKASDQFQRLMQDRRGSAILSLSGKDATNFLQRKTTLTEVGQGYSVPGVMPFERIPGIVPEARQTLTVRDVLFARPTELSGVDFVKVSTPFGQASPVAETVVKPENAVSFTAASERIKTIATWIPASRQIMDDWGELASFFETSLVYYVNLEEELQLLSGDNIGEDLHGLIPQAQPFNTGLLSASHGWNRIDIIGSAISQLTTAKEITPTFCVLHPTDWWGIRLLKDTLGRYLIGDPQSTAAALLFDLVVIPTTSIAAGTFLVGSGNPAAAEIRDRMEIQFEISTSHASFFTQNLIACRAEKRLALVVKRPASYVSGSFTSSPA
jgi:HK97 family phage major capsid protein